MSIGFHDYQQAAWETAIYPTDVKINYTVIGVVNEAGELAGVYKKFLRGDYDHAEMKRRMGDEMGDVLWYLAMLAYDLGIDFEQVAFDNLLKLNKRKRAETLQGDGDDR